MSIGYTVQDKLLKGTAQVIGASVTKQVISEEFRMSGEDSLWSVMKIVFASQTVTTGITVGLQHCWTNPTVAANWEDTGFTAALTGASGTKTLKFDNNVAADAANLPTWAMCRLVITTGTGDGTTINNCFVTRRL